MPPLQALKTTNQGYGLRLDLHREYLKSERGKKRYSFAAVFTLPDPATLLCHASPRAARC